MDFVSIIIPIYNEEAAIGDDIDLILRTMDASGYDYEFIVVDDGSTDRSAEIVRQRPRVQLIQHRQNRGTGAAINTGLRHAKGPIVVMTDGDGTYPNQDIPKLLSFMDEYDMVIGARTKEMGSLPWLRSPAKLFIRLLASYLAEIYIPDLNSGLRCFRKGIAECYIHILPSGHSWVSTITLSFLADGYEVKFVPIDYYQRKGRSSFHPLSDTYNYFLLVIRTVMYFNPLKVFLPLSFLFLTAGVVRQLHQFATVNLHVTSSNVLLVLTGINLGVMGLLADMIARRARA